MRTAISQIVKLLFCLAGLEAGGGFTCMARIVRCSLIQTTSVEIAERPLAEIKQAMIDKHVPLIRQAAAAGSQIVCLQEIFYGPYFCAEQTTRWYDSTESIPSGTPTRLMRELPR